MSSSPSGEKIGGEISPPLLHYRCPGRRAGWATSVAGRWVGNIAGSWTHRVGGSALLHHSQPRGEQGLPLEDIVQEYLNGMKFQSQAG